MWKVIARLCPVAALARVSTILREKWDQADDTFASYEDPRDSRGKAARHRPECDGEEKFLISLIGYIDLIEGRRFNKDEEAEAWEAVRGIVTSLARSKFESGWEDIRREVDFAERSGYIKRLQYSVEQFAARQLSNWHEPNAA
jgi:hypothetical protein